MRNADAIIWLDDERARAARAAARFRSEDHDLLWMSVRAVKRVMKWWRLRRSRDAEGAGHLLDFTLDSQPADPMAAFATMVLSEFPEKVLRVSHDEQIAALNAVRPTR